MNSKFCDGTGAEVKGEMVGVSLQQCDSDTEGLLVITAAGVLGALVGVLGPAPLPILAQIAAILVVFLAFCCLLIFSLHFVDCQCMEDGPQVCLLLQEDNLTA